MDWRSASEIVTGLVMEGRILPSHINPSILFHPYDQAIMLMAQGGDVPAVMNVVGVDTIMSAQSAANAVDKSLDWIGFCTKQASRSQLADLLEKQAGTLRKGTDADIAKIYAAINDVDNYSDRYVTLDKVEPMTSAWIETGYEPVDVHLGGIPKGGLIVIAASPGVGKTYLGLNFIIGSVRNIKKRVLFYSLEMLLGQIVARLIDMADITKEERELITATQEMLDIDDVYADASRKIASNPDDFHFVIIDFADLLTSGMEDEQIVAHIYRCCAQLAKQTKVPVILISQLNRATYNEDFPRVNHIRYSGIAEAMAALILLVYNPSQLWVSGTGTAKKDSPLPIVPGRGWLIVGKSRFGYKEGGIGAFQLDWDGAKGWGSKSYGWQSLSGGVG